MITKTVEELNATITKLENGIDREYINLWGCKDKELREYYKERINQARDCLRYTRHDLIVVKLYNEGYSPEEINKIDIDKYLGKETRI